MSVCRSVCLSALAYLKTLVRTSPNFLYVTCGRGSIRPAAEQQLNTLRTSGVLGDLMFSHNQPNTDTGLESAT